MFIAKLKLGAAVVLALMVSAGAGGLVCHRMAEAAAGQPGALQFPSGQWVPMPQLAPAKAPPRPTRVPSEVEGILVFVGTEVKPGEVVPENKRIVAKCWMLGIRTDNKDVPQSDRLIVPSGAKGVVYRKWRPEDEFAPDTLQVGYVLKTYRKLSEGDSVKEGQSLALFDSGRERDELEIAIAKLDAADLELKLAMTAKEAGSERLERMGQANHRSPGTYAPEEVNGARLTYKQFIQEELAKKAGLLLAKRELQQAHTRLEKCEITSPESGVVKTILVRKGEAVKRLETVLEIQPLDDK